MTMTFRECVKNYSADCRTAAADLIARADRETVNDAGAQSPREISQRTRAHTFLTVAIELDRFAEHYHERERESAPFTPSPVWDATS